MKIEGKKPEFDGSLDRIEPGRAGAAGASRTTAGPPGDHFRVSAEARLAREAVQQAQDVATLRSEAVDRARALLESGRLADAGTVADAIIDSMLDE
jgi:hypothetical protein